MIAINLVQSTAETLMRKASIEIPDDYLTGLKAAAAAEDGDLGVLHAGDGALHGARQQHAVHHGRLHDVAPDELDDAHAVGLHLRWALGRHDHQRRLGHQRQHALPKHHRVPSPRRSST